MSGPKTPYATMKAPRDLADPVDRQMSRLEAREEQEAKERKVVRERAQDKVAKALSDPFYVTSQRWPFLMVQRAGVECPMTVTQFFPNSKLAVDKFYSMKSYEDSKAEVALKKKLLNTHGIKYVYLNPARSLADMQEDLEAQAKV